MSQPKLTPAERLVYRVLKDQLCYGFDSDGRMKDGTVQLPLHHSRLVKLARVIMRHLQEITP